MGFDHHRSHVVMLFRPVMDAGFERFLVNLRKYTDKKFAPAGHSGT